MADWPYNTANWKRLRKAHLSAFPWCEGCKAMGKPHVIANTVDHRVAISDGGNPFPGHDGLASYCPACHSAKTARGTEAGAARSSKPRKGCDATGSPLDPNHPWREDSRDAERNGSKGRGPDNPLSRRGLPAVLDVPPVHGRVGKSLRAGAGRPPSDLQNQLVYKCSRSGGRDAD